MASRKVPSVRLGNSGLKVSRLILGCGAYGSSGWQPWIVNEEDTIKLIKAAYDLGIQTFDTADAYSNGGSEVVLGKAIKQHDLPRDEIVVMTKSEWYYNLHEKAEANGYVNQFGLSRKHIFAGVQASLRRLGLDYVDVLFYYALIHNLTPFIAMQDQYSLLYREEEREMLPTLKVSSLLSRPVRCSLAPAFRCGVYALVALARGLLTHPLEEKTYRSSTDRFGIPLLQGGGKDIIKRVEETAKRRGISMAQIALAWHLHKDGITTPVIGASTEAKLNDLIGALDVELDDQEISYLEAAYKPMPIIGHP
ncbi:hypothetical protein EWM64_g2781 [Hericium alpestre]|uniref:NADP-dependent oxidoreductase domain-containing protein n=1 Tax=Hericium alpestre TaxID=135208 RepID=A0A4Z0A2F8_9AGAM|nr:hypothetical protein EWM64_g2781 [Hericium alpestre]